MNGDDNNTVAAEERVRRRLREHTESVLVTVTHRAIAHPHAKLAIHAIPYLYQQELARLETRLNALPLNLSQAQTFAVLRQYGGVTPPSVVDSNSTSAGGRRMTLRSRSVVLLSPLTVAGRRQHVLEQIMAPGPCVLTPFVSARFDTKYLTDPWHGLTEPSLSYLLSHASLREQLHVSDSKVVAIDDDHESLQRTHMLDCLRSMFADFPITQSLRPSFLSSSSEPHNTRAVIAELGDMDEADFLNRSTTTGRPKKNTTSPVPSQPQKKALQQK